MTRWFVVAYLVPQAISYVYFGEPVMMVKLGGAAEAALLPVIGFAAVYLRHRRLPRAVMPKGWITLALWLTLGRHDVTDGVLGGGAVSLSVARRFETSFHVGLTNLA